MSREKTIAELEDEVRDAGKHLWQVYIFEREETPSIKGIYTVGLRHGRRHPDIKNYEMAIEVPSNPKLAEDAKRTVLLQALRQIREQFTVRWEGHDEP